VQILSGIGGKLGRLASRLATRHRVATEIRQLYQFDDRELRDVGLSRGDFPAIMRGTYRRD
jgi:uncharacterized protein YjiS (DUF1127 family)